MSKDFEESSLPAVVSSAKATKPPGVRKYPVEAHQARAVAVRRIKYRDDRRPPPEPNEFQVWLEFLQFPEVLGAYVPGVGWSEQKWFAEWWMNRELTGDRRLYGAVRDETRQLVADLVAKYGVVLVDADALAEVFE